MPFPARGGAFAAAAAVHLSSVPSKHLKRAIALQSLSVLQQRQKDGARITWRGSSTDDRETAQAGQPLLQDQGNLQGRLEAVAECTLPTRTSNLKRQPNAHSQRSLPTADCLRRRTCRMVDNCRIFNEVRIVCRPAAVFRSRSTHRLASNRTVVDKCSDNWPIEPTGFCSAGWVGLVQLCRQT